MKPLKRVTTALAVMLASIIAVLPAQSADIYNPTVSVDEGVIANNGVDWTGFYAGLLIGYGWGDQDHDLNKFGTPVPDPDGFGSHEPKGFLFGGTVGVNYHVPDTRVVVGAEGDWSYAGHEDRTSVPVGGTVVAFTETEIKSIGTARLRAGYLANPNTLIYGTGGVAWASVETAGGFDDPSTPGFLGVSEEDTNVGWTIGAGLEYKLDNVWSVKADYLYVDLADTVHTAHFGVNTVTLTDDLTEHMVRVGVNAKLF